LGVIFSDGGETEKVQSSVGRSLKRLGAMMDVARLENLKWVVMGRGWLRKG